MSKQEDFEHMEKYVLSTGIRVGTQVKTKFMNPFVTKATNEGLYIIDSKKTLSRIQTAAKFINRANITVLLLKNFVRLRVQLQCLEDSCQEL
jgi:small subunit ribosomal protein S2